MVASVILAKVKHLQYEAILTEAELAVLELIAIGTDPTVLAWAAEKERIVLTHDVATMITDEKLIEQLV